MGNVIVDSREPSLEWGVIAHWTGEHSRGNQAPASVRVLRLGFKIDGRIADRPQIGDVQRATPSALDSWWDLFSSWAAILSNQDPRDHLRMQGAVRREPVWMWVGSADERRAESVSSDVPRWDRHGDPLDADTIEVCAQLAGSGESPPAEWLFIRDARSSITAGDYRRAVIDAGTAAELAITELLDQHLSNVDDELSSALLKRARALEGRSTLMKELNAGSEPIGFTDSLKNPRNNAAHKGHSPSKETAQRAVEIAIELVEQSTPALGLVPATAAQID